MDEKILAVLGAAAGVTLARRGLRPVAKLVVRGVVAAVDASTGARREVAQLYAEAKAEHGGINAHAGAVSASPRP